ncbi:MAG: hypothetical protein QG621_15 [Patescibacteria group bacterium]|nr:hypothetical protein [Patescibacteria group bacterium]
MKSYVIKGFFGVALTLGLFVGGFAHAANLTTTQVQSILGLLQSFGADQTTMSNVSSALGVPYYQNGYYQNGQYSTAYTGCPALSYNLYFGLYDSQTGGQVSQLQRFFGLPTTGYYGSLTRQAVADFQTRYNLYPVTGGVGPLTRQQITQVCGGSGYPYRNGSVQITGVTGPNTLAVNQQGTWTVTTNSPSNSYINVTVQWGDQAAYPYAYSNQTSMVNGQNSFTHSYSYPGTYTVIFTATDNNGHTNSASATVVVGGSSSGCNNYSSSYYCGAPTISSISQSQGSVGTQITITGTGFTASNVVHFGVGGKMSVPSYNNGTTLNYTIPSSVSACDVIQTFAVCTMMAQQVTAGNYPVYVSNANGQSGTVYFTVNGGSQSGSLQVTSPTQGSTYYRGQDMTIAWNSGGTYTSASVTLDLYTSGGTNIGTIAISGLSTGSYTWRIPSFPQNYMCTLQYPNGLCGANIPTGQYYIKATLGGVTSATSGIFTIYQQ